MSDQALKAALGEPARAARYEQYQREIRRGAGRRSDGPRPREFDSNGFPVPQRNSTFVERVARLLHPV
jgi:hypothetical protein